MGCLSVYLTSRAVTNCNGRRATFMSGMFVSRSWRAVAMAVSISDGDVREGLLAAILLRAAALDMLADVDRITKLLLSRSQKFVMESLVFMKRAG
jgi:hypothetical protein